jgi:hypothetical protein
MTLSNIHLDTNLVMHMRRHAISAPSLHPRNIRLGQTPPLVLQLSRCDVHWNPPQLSWTHVCGADMSSNNTRKTHVKS